MTLSQLQYFQTLAHVLHYTRAAEALHIAQPSLSYSIGELEKELGVKLFVKEDRRVSLTMYGEQFLPYVETALATLSDGTQAVRQLSDASYQMVKLGYFHSISATFIPQVVEALYGIEENRKLRFQFSEASSADTLNLLKSGNLDLALYAPGRMGGVGAGDAPAAFPRRAPGASALGAEGGVLRGLRRRAYGAAGSGQLPAGHRR